MEKMSAATENILVTAPFWGARKNGQVLQEAMNLGPTLLKWIIAPSTSRDKVIQVQIRTTWVWVSLRAVIDISDFRSVQTPHFMDYYKSIIFTFCW